MLSAELIWFEIHRLVQVDNIITIDAESLLSRVVLSQGHAARSLRVPIHGE